MDQNVPKRHNMPKRNRAFPSDGISAVLYPVRNIRRDGRTGER